MQSLRVSSIIRAAALVVLLNFGGDIAADSIADARGHHCVSQTSHSDSQHEKTPCSHCTCAIHVGAVVITNSAVRVSRDFQESVFVLTRDVGAVRATCGD